MFLTFTPFALFPLSPHWLLFNHPLFSIPPTPVILHSSTTHTLTFHIHTTLPLSLPLVLDTHTTSTKGTLPSLSRNHNLVFLALNTIRTTEDRHKSVHSIRKSRCSWGTIETPTGNTSGKEQDNLLSWRTICQSTWAHGYFHLHSRMRSGDHDPWTHKSVNLKLKIRLQRVQRQRGNKQRTFSWVGYYSTTVFRSNFFFY